MGVMVLPAFPEQPERICLYRLSLGECHPPSVMDDSSMLLQILVRRAESCQVGAEWPILAEWFEKAEELRRMADNVARATGRDRQVKFVQALKQACQAGRIRREGPRLLQRPGHSPGRLAGAVQLAPSAERHQNLRD